MNRQSVLLSALIISVVVACGYKGPLYLPQKKATSQPASPAKFVPAKESQVESTPSINLKTESLTLTPKAQIESNPQFSLQSTESH